MDRKREAYDAFKEAFQKEIDAAKEGLASTHRDHNEASSAMQSRYDTFREEAEALGVGQKMSIEKRLEDMESLKRLERACLEIRDRVAVGTLVVIEDQLTEAERRYYLVPGGGGRKITVGTEEFVCVNLVAPISRALIKKEVGDVVQLLVDKAKRDFAIICIE